MEVTGVEGNYRITCERVLRLMRNNADSILAVLEAFVYDPVLSWRLTDASTRRAPNAGGGAYGGDERAGGATAGVGGGGDDEAPQASGAHSADAIKRVKAKLSGRHFCAKHSSSSARAHARACMCK